MKGNDVMIFSLLKTRNNIRHDISFAPIEEMLDQTWDLSTEFPIPQARDQAGPLTLFNRFFRRLHDIIESVLQSIVRLSSAAPGLFSIAKEFKQTCIDQETRVTDIAAAGVAMAARIQEMENRIESLASDSEEIRQEVHHADALSRNSLEQFSGISRFMDDLLQTITALDENATSIGSIIDVINTISDETNILSLNARIEAVKLRSNSKGFTVIAEEIAQLAKQSKAATADIQDRLTNLQNRVADTVSAARNVEETVRTGEQHSREARASLETVNHRFESFAGNLALVKAFSNDQTRDVKTVSSDILEVETSVRQQSEAVEQIVTVAEEINRLCDAMIVNTGTFHLSGHSRARATAETMASDPDIRSMSRGRQEKSLAAFLDRHHFIELAYITDAQGRQVTRNIYSRKVLTPEELEQGVHCDWSGKPWFLTPLKTKSAFVSGTYRSSATNRFCFTVSVPLTGTGGAPLGVLAIDINVEDMLNI